MLYLMLKKPTLMNYFIKLGIKCNVMTLKVKGNEKIYYKIIFNQEGFKNLINIIKPYIHPIMNYKIDLNRQKEYYLHKKENKLLKTQILTK
ncbi:MAG: hypothetical protein AABY22_02130, partial [Nanoarchaeota archaeon]